MKKSSKTILWIRNLGFGNAFLLFVVGTLAHAAEPELFVRPLANNAAAPASAQQAVPLSADSYKSATADQSKRMDKIKQRRTTKSISLMRVDINALKENKLRISLSANKKLQLSRKHFKATNPNNFTWSGVVPGTSALSTFVVHNGDVAASIRDENNELYSIEPIGDELYALIKIDESKFSPCGGVLHGDTQEMHNPAPPASPSTRNALHNTNASHNANASQNAEVSQSANPVEIDVMVAYTPAARGAFANIAAQAALAVEETNQTYQNSGVNIRLNLVDSFELNYSENNKTYEGILSDFASLGRSGVVNDRRNQSGADLAMLIVGPGNYENNICGMAYLMTNVSSAFSPYAFGVVTHSCLTGSYVFAHEVGHIQGARHNEHIDSGNYPFPYGHGYIHSLPSSSQNFSTVMSYDWGAGCSYGCRKIPHWSNPDIRYNGIATGTIGTNNNARVLNETAQTVAAFKTASGSRPVCTLAQMQTIPSTGGNYTLSASCTGSPTSYAWTVNGQPQSSRSNSLSYNFPINNSSSVQSFAISVTASNNAGSGSAQTTVNQAAATSGSRPVCTLPQVQTIPSTGGNYTLSASCTGSPTSYVWTVNGQPQSSRSNSLSYNFPINNSSSVQSFAISVTASNNAGSGSAQTTVNQAAATSGSRPVCTLPQVQTIPYTGGNYTLSASCTGSPTSYVWTVNGQPQSSRSNSLSYNFPLNNSPTVQSFAISVTASNNAGSGSAQTTVNQAAATSGSRPACTLYSQVSSIPSTGGNYTLSANCTGSPTNYTWSVNGQLQSSRSNSLSYNFPRNSSSTVQYFRIIFTASNSAGSSSIQATLPQAAAPVSRPVCTLRPQVSLIPSAGGNYMVSASCSGSPTSYTWSVNGRTQSSRSSSLIYNFPRNNSSVAQSFRIVLTANNSAGSSSTQITLSQARR
ncbi:MAG: PKD domain-containing protein [Cystobacterineae bacterium]|nr:PKD domain-containing protein [Cystobacterineae bacterium]